MRTDQTSTIVIIVLSVLMIIFAVLAFYFGRQSSDLTQQKADAESKAQDSQAALGRANSEVQSLKQIIGYAQSGEMSSIEADHTKAIEAYGRGIPGEGEKKGYLHLLNYVADQRDKIQIALNNENLAKLKLENDYVALQKEKDDTVKTFSDALDKTKAELQSAEANYAKSMGERGEIKAKLETDLKTIKEDADRTIKFIQQEAAIANKNVETLSKVNDGLSSELQEMKSPYIEKEDGRIVSVNQLTGRVVINIGAASGLRPGTTFGVFDPENLNMAEAESKGNIEVVQLLGPDKAEARILGTVITNPIQYNDLIYTPVWKPGLHPRFVLSGRMLVAGFGSRALENKINEDDLEDVIKLIMSNGGMVDYYTDSEGKIIKVENDIDSYGNLRIVSRTPANFVSLSVEDLDNPDKIAAIKLGESGDVLRQDTAFVIKGQGDSMNHGLMTNMKILDTQATINGIREITLPELLRRMGWRNATPTRGYGKRANETDLDPRPTRPAGVSRGTVSPLYSQQQGKTLDSKTSPGTVSPLYATTPEAMKTSPGTVSPLFHKDRKPVNQSSGTVSGFYGGK